MKRRESIQIIANLLEAALGAGATKTRLVGKSDLNFIRCEKYIHLLTNKGLLEYAKESDSPNAIFKTTIKGKEALELLLNAEALVFGVVRSKDESPMPDSTEVWPLLVPNGAS